MTVGRGDAITKESFEWVFGSTTDADVVIACAKMGRFMNDIAAFKRGTNKADMSSSVECYISEHKVTSDIAFARIDSLVEDEWKTINQARFERHALLPVVKIAVKITYTIFLFLPR
uniref:Terpene synthase metal-binding domain-containing protein n=1 Tax=Arundo donax TaxID=35708 RepID=A0A0A9DC27_ARUDO